MNPYTSYKDSGVEWIGEIPSEWNRIKVKHLVDTSKYYQIGDGDHGSIKPEMYVESGIPYIRVQNLSWDGKLSKKGLVYIDERVHSENLKSRLIIGDLLVCKTGNTIGKIGVVDKNFGESNTTSSIGKITIDTKRHIVDFVKYVFQSKVIQKPILMTGIEKSCQPGFNNNQLTEFYLFSPPLLDQTQIVSFLDTKTQKIDELIEKTEQKIELLKEKRTSLINHCVTKGLNPNVEMKDSGVEWIGEIPSHWKTPKMMWISNLITDGSHFSPVTTDEGKYYVTVSDVKSNNTIDFINCKKISEESFEDLKRNNCQPMEGDILLTKDGTIGRGLVVSDNDFVILSSLGLIRCDQNIVTPNYLLYYLLSGLCIDQMYSNVRGSGITRLTINLIKNLISIIPSLEEQTQIVEYLDEQTQKIDSTIEKETQRIELLKEYRQSLISEVVTGKIDVRD